MRKKKFGCCSGYTGVGDGDGEGWNGKKDWEKKGILGRGLGQIGSLGRGKQYPSCT